MKILAFIIIFTCICISSMMFIQQVVQKINPYFGNKTANYISITLALLFVISAVLFGGSDTSHWYGEYE